MVVVGSLYRKTRDELEELLYVVRNWHVHTFYMEKLKVQKNAKTKRMIAKLTT